MAPVSDNGQTLAQKRAMFAQLDALAEEDDGHDEGFERSKSALKSYQERTSSSSLASTAQQSSSGHLEAPSRVLQRSVSVKELPGKPSVDTRSHRLCRSESTPARRPAKSNRETSNDEVTIIHDTPVIQQRTAAAVGQTNDLEVAKGGMRPTQAATKTLGKRKRSSGLHEVPVEQQIFRGLTMMSIPVDDKNAARRLRMQKAVEYGAERVTEFTSKVSHIVVDTNLTYSDVLKFMKKDTLSDELIVVSENYPSDCIAAKAMIDPQQQRYGIKGMENTLPRQPRKAPSEPSDTSLQLKPAKGKDKRDITYEPRTPSRTDEESIRAPWTESQRSSNQQEPAPAKEANAEAKASPAVHTDVPGEALDALTSAIEEAKAAPSMPSEFYEDDSRPGSSEGPADSGDEHNPSQKGNAPKKKAGYTKAANWQHTFQCMQGHDGKAGENPNAKTIAILQEMENYYYSIRDEWRTRAYRKAMATLRKQTHRIITKEEAQALPEIGERLAQKIEEIVWTNKLQRLENAKLEPTDHALNTFLNIYGVGFRQASKWVQEGYRSLEDLLKSPSVKLTANQKIGVEHYEDFKLRIPRSESDKLANIVRRSLQSLDKDFQIMIGGSYRRGAKDSGDLDLIITKPGSTAEYLRHVVLETTVPHLERVGFLTAGLAVTSKDDGSKWHGACQLPLNPTGLSATAPNDPRTNKSPWRRIDLLLVPWDELGAAMIYFTGNDIFNRSMRLLARKKGMRLNQRGLYKDVMRKGAEKLTDGTKISGNDEKEIFDVLGVPYRGPEGRNC